MRTFVFIFTFTLTIIFTFCKDMSFHLFGAQFVDQRRESRKFAKTNGWKCWWKLGTRHRFLSKHCNLKTVQLLEMPFSKLERIHFHTHLPNAISVNFIYKKVNKSIVSQVCRLFALLIKSKWNVERNMCCAHMVMCHKMSTGKVNAIDSPLYKWRATVLALCSLICAQQSNQL